MTKITLIIFADLRKVITEDFEIVIFNRTLKL